MVYDQPESHFVFSKVCPECSRLNEPPTLDCPDCTARTHWESPEAYVAFLKRVKTAARSKIARGVAEVIAGALSLTAAVAMLFFAPIVSVRILFLFVLAFMILVPDGIATILRGRKYGRFR